MSKDIDLSDPGAWDDSALIRSWDEALEEYKKYHSIHVQGKKLSEVLSKDELEMLTQNGVSMKEDSSHGPTDGPEDSELDQEQMEDGYSPEVNDYLGTPGDQEAESETANPTTGTALPSGTINVPQALLNNVEDESLKTLMMAWYWAGYYTGFHDGRRPQPSNAQASQGSRSKKVPEKP